ncbi:FtsX-like permease family protein [Streptomyces pseudovenezuelae]|uniref:ABC transport system permease protein n=1 Tax=Streptomyces pseudovenezuelae TaxID=67350 RepID=A0ABT6LHI9_9ACTN|nr:FtsX-like permease family protein [Streptomyces pseudovenezuelae]MDH6215782.1 putative ABC transport system permease protein [Streptomyces pseudovenezuelae]
MRRSVRTRVLAPWSRTRVLAPWVRTRLGTAPGAACALALLVVLTACLAAALPRAVDRYEDAGLRHAVERARPDSTSVSVYAAQPDPLMSQGMREDALRPDLLGAQYRKVLAAVPRPLVADPDQSTYGVRTHSPMEVPDAFIPRPNGLPAQVALAAQHDLAGHVRSVTGRLPRASEPVTAATAEVEAAVTAETAKSMHIKVGSVIHVPGVERGPLAVHITGIVTPRDPNGAYWAAQPLLHTPTLVLLPGAGAEGDRYWLGGLLLAPEAAPAMLGTPGNPWRYWQLAPAPGDLHAYELGRLKSAIASLEGGPALRAMRTRTDPSTDVSTDLDDVLGTYTDLRSGIRPLVAVAAVGTGTVAAVVLLMAGGLAADRRRSELLLLRARGGSLRGVTGRLLAETSIVSLPAGALGLTAALLALPGGRLSYAVAAAATVTAVACTALPLRAAAVHRVVRIHGAREDVASVRPSRRRTVAELTLLVVTLGAVETLRRNGTSGDELASLAPVLVGVAAALVLVRLYPLPLRGLARPAARLRGAVGHLSLARAGRTSASAVLPLLALLTALTTAAFGGSVLSGVSEARDQAALLTVGADARVEGTTALPSSLPDRVRGLHGVRGVAAVSIAYQAKPNEGRQSVPLVGVDPRDYAELTSRTGLGAFGAGELRVPAGADAGSGTGTGTGTGSGSGALPAVASPQVASTYGTRPFPVRLEDGTTVTVRITLVRDRTPAVTGADFLLVDRAGLSADAARPSTLLLTGDHLDGAALRRMAGNAGVLLRSEERAQYVDSPLQSGAERVYTAAVAAGAGYAVLALLLSLVRAAPERRALLARLRTMGLTRAQGRRLLVLESLPQAVLAAAGGALTGWAAIRLLSPGIDLTTIALASAQVPVGAAELHTDAVSLTVPALAIIAVTVGVAGVQAWWTGRRGSVAELRVGDGR